MQSSDNPCPPPKRAENAGIARATPRNLRDVIGLPASAHDGPLGQYSMSTPFLPARLERSHPKAFPYFFPSSTQNPIYAFLRYSSLNSTFNLASPSRDAFPIPTRPSLRPTETARSIVTDAW